MLHHTYDVSFVGRRSNNEDAVFAWNLDDSDHPLSVIAVADGMGGRAGGEIASSIAVDVFSESWQDFLDNDRDLHPDEVRRFLLDTFRLINSRIRERINEESELMGMGTTLVVAIATGLNVMVANTGDSRAYRVSPGLARQITLDHSVVAESIRDGITSAEDAADSPYRHALTRCLDGGNESEPDIFPDTGWMSAPEGTVILCASDGLTQFVSEDEIHTVITEQPTLEAACEELVVRAYEAGSADNVSVSALEFGEFERSQTAQPSRRVDDLALPPEMKRRRMSVFQVFLVAVLLLVIAVGAVGIYLSRTQSSVAAPTGAVSVSSADQYQLPFSSSDTLSWSYDGDAVDHFQVNVVQRHPVEPDEPRVQMTINGYHRVSLQDLALANSRFFKEGATYSWYVRAVVDGEEITSAMKNIHIRDDSEI